MARKGADPDVLRYGGMIQKAAKMRGISPSLLAALVHAESGGVPTAGSPAGARGLTQLMPGTARGLGVKNITDPWQNLLGGATYLANQLKQFGSQALALSAYNSGPGGAEASGRVEGYPETQAYVQRVLQLENYYRNLGQGPPLGAAAEVGSPGGEPARVGGLGALAPGTPPPVLEPGHRNRFNTLAALGRLGSQSEMAASARTGSQTTINSLLEMSGRQGQVAQGAQQAAQSLNAVGPVNEAPPVGGLNAEFSRRLNQLMKAVKAQGGSLTIGSGARSEQEQAVLWANALKKYGSESAARKWVAPPGKSNHDPNSGQRHGFGAGGVAADLRGDLQLAHELAPKFGLTFPLSNEAWHIEPAGMRK